MKLHFLLLLAGMAWQKNTAAQCVAGDCRNGKGTYTFPSGSRYTGEFKDGEVSGYGVCAYKSGGKYEGMWKSRFPEGKGTRTYKDGSVAKGNWHRGQLWDEDDNPVFSKNSDDGTDIQAGCLLGDCQSGLGLYAFPDGSKYEGEFKTGKADGWGTFFYTNGDRYIGNFKSNFSDGKGSIYHSDGKKTVGIWKRGEYIGNPAETTAATPEEAKSKLGCLRGDCENGSGVFAYRDGNRYVGQFKKSKPDGKGLMTYANREKYKGYWENGSYQGVGTLYAADGTKTEGTWEQGIYKGDADFADSDIPNGTEEKSVPEKLIKPEKPKFDRDTPPKSELITSANSRAPKVWVMVVGVAAYDHMPVLKYTDDDAYRMYAFFKSPEGGSVPDEQMRILIDEEATKSNIKKTMTETFMKAGSNDLVILYFSGHGIKGSFLPIDFDGSNNKLPHEEITAALKASPAKYKLCIADACHSGSLLAARGTDVQNMLANYYASLAQASPGTALIMSSKSEENSLESSGLRQGVFSHFLIRGLKGEADADGDHIVTVQELYTFISSKVRSYTGNRQSPVIQGTYDPTMTISVAR